MDWLQQAKFKMNNMPQAAKDLKLAAEEDLFTFAQLVNPMRVYGDIHKDVFDWLQNDIVGNQLLLLPRAHMKSHCIAVWAAWWITKHPETSILYLSATAELAEKQLYDIKNILTGDAYSRYWPDMLNPEEGKREKWATSKIAVCHPQRRLEGIRDWTVATAGLTTNTTGWHADVILADDVVVPDNAYTEDGRRKVTMAMSQMTSIRNTGGFTKACGTRYHPSDIYDTWKKQTMMLYDEVTAEVIDVIPVWDINEHVVEIDNIFLWPREVRGDGKAFGFDINQLSRIKAEYEDATQFFAQYYNDPNDPASARITYDKFQYFDPKFIKREHGDWVYKGYKLNIYASVDFAFSLSKRADSTAIVVIGIDSENNVYVLDIARFKTDKVLDYYKEIGKLHSRWEFKKMRAEVSVAQKVIVNGIKDHIKKDGMRLSIEEFRPSRHDGSKQERIAAALEPRYDDMQMWHYRGGYTGMLEEELVLARPPHDDLKDALASAVEMAIRPKQRKKQDVGMFNQNMKFHSRFGGVN